ncbi:hypothetical protein [Pseudochrobactrum asaccharolyticum]|uniref:hypothetical protein n=1 Tax=Pseudochrobactrum asaccharolyticum TaxID=354351 RepID=UPI000DE94877|nr:hypothetical protein [Pseudochrobactrum asaccharolyticum]
MAGASLMLTNQFINWNRIRDSLLPVFCGPKAVRPLTAPKWSLMKVLASCLIPATRQRAAFWQRRNSTEKPHKNRIFNGFLPLKIANVMPGIAFAVLSPQNFQFASQFQIFFRN